MFSGNAPLVDAVSPEELRREIRQVIPPIAPHVALLRRREPVLDLMLLKRIVQGLRTRKQAVLLPAGDVEQSQFPVRRSRVREEILECLLRVSARSRAERADVVELVEMRKADPQRLAAAHRETRQRAIVSLGRDAIEFLDVRDDVLQRSFPNRSSALTGPRPADGTSITSGS